MHGSVGDPGVGGAEAAAGGKRVSRPPGTEVGKVAPWVCRQFGLRSGRTISQPLPSVYVGADDNPSTAASV